MDNIKRDRSLATYLFLVADGTLFLLKKLGFRVGVSRPGVRDCGLGLKLG